MIKDTTLEPPKFTSLVTLEEWMEIFGLFLGTKVGANGWTFLSYLLRDDDAVQPIGPVAQGAAHSIENGSIIEDMIQRIPMDHNLVASDDAMVYSLLEEMLRGSKYHPSLAPFKRGTRVDGRDAWKALMAQYCGPAFWDGLFRESSQFLTTRTWEPNTTVDLKT